MRVPIYWLLLVIFPSAFGQSKLLSVHVVFRHGARAPVLNFTSEEAKSHFYRGLGQLTDEGIEQATLVGQFLKDRYLHPQFIDPRLIPSEVLFRSSPVERCLMTIETVGKVMFPNATPPVQTVPRNDDYLLLPKMNCPFLLDEYQKFFNLSEVEKKHVETDIWDISNRALDRAVAKTTHLKDKSHFNLPALILEKEAGLAVPSWFNEDAYKEAKQVFYSALSVMSSIGDYLSPRGIRPKSGLLLYTILDDIKKRTECYQKNQTKCDKQRFQVYSSHDILMLSLLESLGLRVPVLGEDTAPEFLATLIIETWIMDGRPAVKVFYRKFPKDYAPQEVTTLVRNCPWDKEVCPVELFISCCNEYITADPKTECYGSTPNSSREDWEMNLLSWILAAVALVFLIFSLILIFLVIRYKNRSKLELKVGLDN